MRFLDLIPGLEMFRFMSPLRGFKFFISFGHRGLRPMLTNVAPSGLNFLFHSDIGLAPYADECRPFGA